MLATLRIVALHFLWTTIGDRYIISGMQLRLPVLVQYLPSLPKTWLKPSELH